MQQRSWNAISVRGALLATASALLMSVLMAMAKALPASIPSTLVLFIRSIFVLFFALPLLGRNPREALKSDQYVLHGLQILLGIGATLCTYHTYRSLPVTLATSLGMTGALFTTLLSVLILKDKVDRTKWLCILAGYLGTLCIIQPQSMQLELGIFTALLANLMAGLGAVTAKILSQRVDERAIIIYNTLGMTFFFAFLSYAHWALLDRQMLLKLASMGVLALTSNYCYLISLKQASPSFLAPFEYTRLVFALVIGFIFFQELPQVYTLVGSILIIGATYTSSLQGQQNAINGTT